MTLHVSIEPADYESRLARAIGPVSEPFGGGVGRQLRQELIGAQGRVFDAVTGPPLSSSYAARKSPGLPLLVASGRLRASLLGGADTELSVENSDFAVGSSLRYAEPVQDARAFLLSDEQALEVGERVVGADLDERVARASGGVLEVE